MAFILTAQLKLQAPTNVASIRRQIQNQLKGINVNLAINLPKTVNTQLNAISKQTNSVSKSAADAADNFERFGESLANVVKRFGTFTIATTAFFTLIKAIKQGVDDAITFDTTLTKIRQAAGLSVQSLKPLTQEIDKLATGLGVSSLKLADVSRILVQAGLSAKDTKVALNALAKSELTPSFDDIINTTEGAIAIFQQFGKTAADLESILSSINTVSAKFAVESEDIITAVRRAGGSFESAGGDLNQLIGLFTSVRATTRASAESIATGFRTIFARIQRNRTQDFLRSFGVELRFTQEEAEKFGKSANTFVGPFKAIQRLSNVLNQLESTDPKFAEIIEELGGYRQIDKVIPLIKQFATAQNAYNLAVRSTDSLSKDAIKAQDSLAVQFAKVREEFTKLIRDFSNDGSIRAIIKTMLDLANSIKEIGEGIKNVLPQLIGFGGVFALGKATSVFRGFSGGAFNNQKTSSVSQNAANNVANPNLIGGGVIGALTIFESLSGTFYDLNDTTKDYISNVKQITAQFLLLRAALGLLNGNDKIQKKVDQGQQTIGLKTAESDLLKAQQPRIKKALDKADADLVKSIKKLRNASTDYGDAVQKLQNLRSGLSGLFTPQSQIDAARKEAKKAFIKYTDVYDETVVKSKTRSNIGVSLSENRKEINIREQEINVINKEIDEHNKLITRMNIFTTGLSFASSALSFFGKTLEDRANKELASIRAGTSTDSASSRRDFILGRTLGGAGTFAAAGGIAGVNTGFGVTGGAIGAAIGGLFGAVDSFITATNEFTDELKNARFGRNIDRLDDVLSRFTSGKASPVGIASDVRTGARELQNRLLTATRPQDREDVLGRIDSAIDPIQKFINKLAESSGSVEDFTRIAGPELIEFFTNFNKIPLDEFSSSIQEIINANKNLLKVESNIIEARKSEEARLLLNLRFADSVNAASKSVEGFNSALDSVVNFANNSVGSGAKVNFSISDVIPDLSRVVDVDSFENNLKRIESAFSGASSTLAADTLGAAKAIQALPNILFNLRSADPFGETGTIIDRLEEQLLRLGNVPDFVLNTILAKAQEQVGAELKDTNLLDKLNKDFIGTLGEMTRGISNIAEPFGQAADQLQAQINGYLEQLEIRKEFEKTNISNINKLIDIEEKRIRSLSSTTNSPTNFSSLRNLQNQRQQSLLGVDSDVGNNAVALGERLNSLQKEELIIKQQLNTDTTLTSVQMVNLGAYLVDVQTRTQRLGQALTNLTDTTEQARIIQEQLSEVEKDRAFRFDIAKEATFADPKERARLGKTLDATRIAAFTGSIESIPIALRKEVGNLLSRIGDTRLESLGGLSGDEVTRILVENNLITREGFSLLSGELSGITRASSEESALKTELGLVFETAKKAQEELNKNAVNNQNAFYNNLSGSFSNFLNNLNTILANSAAANNQGRLIELVNQMQQNTSNLDLVTAIEGLSGESAGTVKAIVPELLASFKKVETASEGLAKFNGILSRSRGTDFLGGEIPFVDERTDRTGKVISRSVDQTPVLRQFGFAFNEIQKGLNESKVKSFSVDTGRVGFKDLRNETDAFGFVKSPTTSQADALNALSKIQTDLGKTFGQDAALEFRANFEKQRFNKILAPDGNRVEVLKLETELTSALKEFTTAQDILLDDANRRNQSLLGGVANPEMFSRNFDQISKLSAQLEKLPANITSAQLAAEKQRIQAEYAFIQSMINNMRSQKFASGGVVPGTGNKDSVATMLMPGEYVLRKDAVQKIGIGTLNKMNSNPSAIKYKATGGVVGNVAQTGGNLAVANFSQLESAIQNFGINVDKLTKAFDNFPREIQLTGRHFVEVVFNGTQVFENLKPEMQMMVEGATKQAINRMLKDKFPEVGLV